MKNDHVWNVIISSIIYILLSFIMLYYIFDLRLEKVFIYLIISVIVFAALTYLLQRKLFD